MSYKEEIAEYLKSKGYDRRTWQNLTEVIFQYQEDHNQSNLLDQKIDEEGNVLDKPNLYDQYISGERGALILVTNTPKQKEIELYKNTPTLRQEREESKERQKAYDYLDECYQALNTKFEEQEEELKRLKEEKDEAFSILKGVLDEYQINPFHAEQIKSLTK